jgi:hypothetical protein
VVPPAACDDDLVLGITRTSPQSSLEQPPWIQVCTLCPVDSIVLTLVDEAATLIATQSYWADSGHCAVAMAREARPAQSELSVRVQLRSGERFASWSFAAAASPAPSSPPLDLGSGTYLAQGGLGSLRLPSLGAEVDPALLEIAVPDLLISILPPTKDGGRAVHIGQAEDGIQDLCVPTARLDAAGVAESGEVWGTLAAGARLPSPFAGPVARGTVHAQLSDDGSYLEDVVVLATIDLLSAEPLTGLTPEESCLGWEEQLGSDPCVPCGDPADGAEEPAACIATVLEWASAPRIQVPLEAISPEAVSPDCPSP